MIHSLVLASISAARLRMKSSTTRWVRLGLVRVYSLTGRL